MNARKYSYDEISTMRYSLMAILRSVNVEDRLRTYMANGTEPEELVAAALKAQASKPRIVFIKHTMIGLDETSSIFGSWAAALGNWI